MTTLRLATLVALLAAAPGAAAAPPVALPLEGRWRCVGTECDGKAELGWVARARQADIEFKADRLTWPTLGDGPVPFALPDAPAGAIDVTAPTPKGAPAVLKGTYSLDGDRLKICWAILRADSPRPAGFATRPGDGHVSLEFERVAPGAPPPDAPIDRLAAILREANRTRAPELKPAEAEALAARALKLAADAPGTDEAAVALLWTLANAPNTLAGRDALARLKTGALAGARLASLSQCLGMGRSVIGPGSMPDAASLELAPLLLERVRQTPSDPGGGGVLAAVCSTYRDDGSPEPPAAFAGAAALIAARHAASPEIGHFPEALANLRQRPWAIRYEPTLRKVLAATTDGLVRCDAAYALAVIVAGSGEARQAEGAGLLAKFVADYDRELPGENWSGIAKFYVDQAKVELAGLAARGLGRPAPALKGLDLDGKPMDLAEHKGKVVLVSFWATWCAPCMRLLPRERKLVESLKGRPFALVGVNGDEPGKLDAGALKDNPAPGRSFVNARPGGKSVSEEWGVGGWPTLVLIDHTGVVRRAWQGAPPEAELVAEVERLVTLAEGKPPAPRP